MSREHYQEYLRKIIFHFWRGNTISVLFNAKFWTFLMIAKSSEEALRFFLCVTTGNFKGHWWYTLVVIIVNTYALNIY